MCLQTQCSTLAKDSSIVCNVKRLLPTVGCEADAVAYKEEAQTSKFLPEEEQQPAARFVDDGSWTIPADLTSKDRYWHVGPSCSVPMTCASFNKTKKAQLA